MQARGMHINTKRLAYQVALGVCTHLKRLFSVSSESDFYLLNPRDEFLNELELRITLLDGLIFQCSIVRLNNSQIFETIRDSQSKHGGRSGASIPRRVSPTGQAENWLSSRSKVIPRRDRLPRSDHPADKQRGQQTNTVTELSDLEGPTRPFLRRAIIDTSCSCFKMQFNYINCFWNGAISKCELTFED